MKLIKRSLYLITAVGLFLTVLAATVVVVAAIPGCKPSPKTPEPLECQYDTLATLEAAYVAEATQACKGKTRPTCEAMPAIEAKYSAKREEWIRCHR